MRILESFILGKENNPLTCEDGVFISEKLVAVIDGVTAKGSRMWNGHKSGYFAKEVLLQTLQELVDGDDNCLLADEQRSVLLLEKLDMALYDAVLSQGGDDMPTEEYPRASIILYNDITKEVISYGDCQCSMGGRIHSHGKEVDRLNSDLRAYHLEYQLLCGATIEELAQNDPGRAAIKENLRIQLGFENRKGEFGYPVLNGCGIEKTLIKRYKVREGDVVILASDGYPRLGKSLEESERALQQILREDPMCFRVYRSTKGVMPGNVSFDDRAFCEFIV